MNDQGQRKALDELLAISKYTTAMRDGLTQTFAALEKARDFHWDSVKRLTADLEAMTRQRDALAERVIALEQGRMDNPLMEAVVEVLRRAFCDGRAL